MKLVIDIPEEVYKYIKFYREFNDLTACVATLKAIDNGIPLPKGHGDLKDINKIYKALANEYRSGRISWGANEIFKDLLGEGRTIIEADKESE